MFATLPADLDTMPPGPELAAALSHVDVNEVSGFDRVVVLRAHQRMRSHYAAAVYEDMAAISDVYHGEIEPDQFIDYAEIEMAAAAEIRCALHLTRRTADSQLGFAHHLRARLPRVMAALAHGSIDVARAWVLVGETIHLPEDDARAVVDEVMADAPGWTTTQIRRRVRRLCILIDPESAADRYRKRVQERRVVSSANVDGTADLTGYDLPPDRVAAAARHVDHLARQLRRRGETRTMDQLRADVFLDLLCGTGKPDGGKGAVFLKVDVATLVGLCDEPGDLGGYGPVVADLARQLAAGQPDVEWRYAITDPDTDRICRVGTTRRRPTTAQRRHVEARDETCIFPGCVTPSPDCDLDHRVPWAQSHDTGVDNLAAECELDHTIRHSAGWSYAAHGDADWIWRSPLGHNYISSGRSP